MTPTPEQIAKLPQWAQKHIEELQRDSVYHQHMAEKTISETKPSDFWVRETLFNPTVKLARRFIPAQEVCVGDPNGFGCSIFTEKRAIRITGIMRCFLIRPLSNGSFEIVEDKR